MPEYTWSIGCAKLTFWPCQLAAKKVRLRRMGPPTEKPYWFSLMSGLGLPSALAKNSLELSARLRKNSNSVPWNWLVPEGVAPDTAPPLLRPCSAVKLLVVTLYSCTLSGWSRYTLFDAFPTEDSLASMPSMVVLEAISREPFT